jgi:hypothetical protein
MTMMMMMMTTLLFSQNFLQYQSTVRAFVPLHTDTTQYDGVSTLILVITI